MNDKEHIDTSILRLLKLFKGSYINDYNEIIVHSEHNIYFNLKDCKTLLDIKCKILEWFIRPIYKGALCTKYFDYSMYSLSKKELDIKRNQVDFYWCDVFEMSDHKFKNELSKDRNGYTKHGMDAMKVESQNFIDAIEKYLDTTFIWEELEIIYTKLGNNVNGELTKKFILGNYNIDLLKEVK